MTRISRNDMRLKLDKVEIKIKKKIELIETMKALKYSKGLIELQEKRLVELENELSKITKM